MAQNFKDMTLDELEKANQSLSRQRTDLKKQQAVITAEIDRKMAAEKAARPPASQVIHPKGIDSAAEFGKL